MLPHNLLPVVDRPHDNTLRISCPSILGLNYNSDSTKSDAGIHCSNGLIPAAIAVKLEYKTPYFTSGRTYDDEAGYV